MLWVKNHLCFYERVYNSLHFHTTSVKHDLVNWPSSHVSPKITYFLPVNEQVNKHRMFHYTAIPRQLGHCTHRWAALSEDGWCCCLPEVWRRRRRCTPFPPGSQSPAPSRHPPHLESTPHKTHRLTKHAHLFLHSKRTVWDNKQIYHRST